MNRVRHLLPALALAAICASGSACGPAAAPVVVAADQAEGAAGKTFLWRATNPRQPAKTLYVLGSVHVGREEIYPLDRAITQAFAECEALVVEVNLEALDPTELIVLVLTRAMLPEGQTLRDRLSPAGWDRLAQGMNRMGVPVESLLTYEPWFVALNLMGLRAVAEGFLPELGIDAHFIERAEGRMEILELETAAFQIDLFDGMPDEVQELMLIDSLEGDIQTGGDIEALMELWEVGDAEGLERMVIDAAVEDPTFAPLFRRMVIDRNYTMTARIEEILRRRDALFVVVGAGHVVGEEGIVAQLADKGWTVTQLDQLGR